MNMLSDLFSFIFSVNPSWFAGIMIVWAIFILWRFMGNIYYPLIEDIDRANKAFSVVTDPASFSHLSEQIEETLNQSKFLSPIWHEFKETITTTTRETGETIWQNTKRPHSYFTADAILGQRGSLHQIDYLPSIFIGIGLFVTFFGLAVAINDTASAIGAVTQNGATQNGEISGVLNPLQSLLDVASLKFVTSVAGIFCSIVLTLSIKSMQSEIHKKLNQLHYKMERCFEFLSTEKLQLRTIDAIENISISISKGVSDGIQNVAGSELRVFADELKSITVSLSNAQKDIKGLGDIYVQQIQQIEKAFQGSLGIVSETFDDWSTKLQGGLKDIDQATNSQLQGINTRIEDFVVDANMQAQKTYQDIEKALSNTISAFSEVINQLSQDVSKYSEITKKDLTGIEEMVNALEKTSKGFVDVSQKFLNAIDAEREGMDNHIGKFSDIIYEMKNAIRTHAENLKQVVTEVSNSATQNEKNKVEHEKQITDIINQMGITMNTVNIGFQSVQENMEKSFQPLTLQIEKLVEKIDEQNKNPISRFFPFGGKK